ncbi:unnamed protein product [Periconia digitata]|uniref:Uncharacterized protein n=1 Tax=Periconia digitata TaxID=1303443 RepID=A0A9W4UL07_9PLEO|nr:unnamed protein product [Periconia digitata]
MASPSPEAKLELAASSPLPRVLEPRQHLKVRIPKAMDLLDPFAHRIRPEMDQQKPLRSSCSLLVRENDPDIQMLSGGGGVER